MKKFALFSVLLAAAAMLITGCGPCPPELSGTDDRLLGHQRRTTLPTQPSPQHIPPTPRARVHGKTILIDPGHGGRDPGTLGTRLGGSYGLPEKTVVLDISRKVAARLEEMGANVRMTRTGDYFVELDDRAAMVARYNADILVSIHADYAENNSAAGPTVFIARQAMNQSQRLAESIIREFEINGISTRGVRRANYRVLVAHSKPSTLVEVGFLSNPQEARQLNTEAYRTRVAAIIAQGIANSF